MRYEENMCRLLLIFFSILKQNYKVANACQTYSVTLSAACQSVFLYFSVYSPNCHVVFRLFTALSLVCIQRINIRNSSSLRIPKISRTFAISSFLVLVGAYILHIYKFVYYIHILNTLYNNYAKFIKI